MVKFEMLDSTHDRSGFDCGVGALNQYLQQTARQHISKEIAKTFVAVDGNAVVPKPVLGFFTISILEMRGQEVPTKWAKKFPDKIPAMRLGRLAVARGRQGTGLGFTLLAEALYQVSLAGAILGGIGVVVDAKDEAAAAFYRKFGFEAAFADPLKLFMPAETIRSFKKPG